MDDLSFFKKLILAISSSLEPEKALLKTFHFLAEHFPIDAISLNSYNHEMRSLHLQFLVTKSCYMGFDTFLPLTDDEAFLVSAAESKFVSINVPRCSEDPSSQKLVRGVMGHIAEEKDRACLHVVMKTEEEVVGHLSLIGKEIDCFTSDHMHKICLMEAPISLALINMRRYRKIQELRKRLDEHRLQLAGEVKLLKNKSIIGGQSGLHKTMEIINQLAGKEAPALIQGETGTGKEVVADAIQRISPRADKPYVKINCGAIPETLIDSELFGHQKGAFTGALTTKMGRFEQADGGTLFLDEVGELPPQAQVRLLRVLQNGTFERVGGEKPIKVDVRIIAATNRPLKNMLQQGTFRDDLYYRLNVFPIHLPPLRERGEDIPLLVRYFIKVFSRQMKLSDDVDLDLKCLEKLQTYSWPGNVRELRNLVERALTISPSGPLNISRYLPQDSGGHINEGDNEDDLKQLIRDQVREILAEERSKESLPAGAAIAESSPDHQIRTLDSVMAEHIRMAVDRCNGKINGPGGVAEKLGIHPNTLRKRMEKLDIRFGYKR